MRREDTAKIELYVAERSVARHEVAFQRWVERVTAPLHYVCVGNGADTRPCSIELGKYIQKFEEDDDSPHRQGMSAFSGFSMARDQGGVWFREGKGDAEEDRVTIYTFLVARELGEVAYFAIRERFARTILREGNEQAVLLSCILDQGRGLQTELVHSKQCNYRQFAEAFGEAARAISTCGRVDLAWMQLHLFQLLQRDLMASAAPMSPPSREEIFWPLAKAFDRLVRDIFKGKLLDRMSTSVLGTWVRIAKELLADTGDDKAVQAVTPHVQQALKSSILEIADSLWRFQGHSFAGAGDLDCDSCGVEAFAFVASLNAWQHQLNLGLDDTLVVQHLGRLKTLSTNPNYLPHFFLRDWRGLSYALAAGDDKDLAPAFGLRTQDAILKSGISDERTWYGFMERLFPR